MEFIGRLIQVLPPKTGVSRTSGKEWKMQEFIVRQEGGKYPTTICFEAFNKDIPAKIGEDIEVRFDIDAHEHNGRWFNSLKAWDIRAINGVPREVPVQPQAPVPPTPTQVSNSLFGEQEEDLPF